jgi:hypothetical protein
MLSKAPFLKVMRYLPLVVVPSEKINNGGTSPASTRLDRYRILARVTSLLAYSFLSMYRESAKVAIVPIRGIFFTSALAKKESGHFLVTK